VPTSAFESREQFPALAGAEFALVDCGTTVAGWDSGAAAGALEFAFAAGACPHAASRLAPTRINTNKYNPVLFIYSFFLFSFIDGCLALRIKYSFRKVNLDNPPHLPALIRLWNGSLGGYPDAWPKATMYCILFISH
jgi:hypothetical protein